MYFSILSVFLISYFWILNPVFFPLHTQPPAPLNPDQTKRSEGEPSVEKARVFSLVKEEKVVSAASLAQVRSESRPNALNQMSLEVNTPTSDPAPDISR